MASVLRGPERFFYDTSTYTASQQLVQGQRRAPSPLCRSGSQPGLVRRADKGEVPTRKPSKDVRLCALCDHTWLQRAGAVVVDCPECSVRQPYAHELTPADQAEALRVHELNREEAARARKAEMAEASRGRSSMPRLP